MKREFPCLLRLLRELPSLRRSYRRQLLNFRARSNRVRLQVFSLVIILAVALTMLSARLEQPGIRQFFFLLAGFSAAVFAFTTLAGLRWTGDRALLTDRVIHLVIILYVVWLTLQLHYGGGDVRSFVTYAGGLLAVAAVYTLDPLFFLLLSIADALLLFLFPLLEPQLSVEPLLEHLTLVVNLLIFAVIISLLNYLITLELLLIKRSTDAEVRRAELALEGGNLGYWYWDIGSGEIEVDGRWMAILGYPEQPSRISFDEFFRMLSPEDRPLVARGIQRYMDGEEPFYRLTFRMLDRSGNERWIYSAGSVTEYDGRGRPSRMHGIHQDVHQVRSQQLRLAESEERFRTYTENAPVGVSIVERGEFLYVNPETVRITGYSEEELLSGMGLLRLIYPGERARAVSELKKLLRLGSVEREYLFRIISRDGNVHWIEARVAVLDWRRMRLLISAIDVSEREAARSRLEAYATYDELTGIYNRRVGLALLEKEMHRTEREHSPISVCYLDVNGLKEVNDRWGHGAGDRLLREVVRGITDTMRKGDVLCRLGGDEFLVIFPRCVPDDAEQIWQRVREYYAALNGREDRRFTISVSHGIAEYSGERIGTVDELLRESDSRMYEEKRRFRSERI